MHTLTVPFGGWPDPNVTIAVARTTADLSRVSDWLWERRGQVLGLDIETNARDPWHRGFRVRTVQMADLYSSVVIVLPQDVAPEDSAMHSVTSELLNRHPHWCAHFSEADIRFAVRGLPGEPIRLGDKEPHVSDTQTVLAVYDPRTVTTMSKKDRIHPLIPLRKGLKETTSRLLTPALQQAEDVLHQRFREIAPVGYRQGKKKMITWGFANVADDDPAYLTYAGLDPVACVRLYHLMKHTLEGRGQWARTEAALVEQWMIDQGTLAGMQVDERYVRWLAGELGAAIHARTTALAQHGIGASGQGPSVGNAFRAMGVTSPKIKDGTESWDRDALAEIAEWNGHPAAQLARDITAVRKATKFSSAYIAPMLRALDAGDGAMHGSIRAIGTVTTRMSAQGTESAGALQQLPKKDPRVRAAVRARRGHVLVSADFAQGEPFTMAALSGDEVYLADLMSGDINSTIAATIYGAVYNSAQGKIAGTLHYLMRQNAKAAWLALCYSAGAAKFTETLNKYLPPEYHLTPAQGAAARQALRARYVKLWALSDAMNQLSVIHLDSGHRVPLWDRVFVDQATGELIVGDRPSRLGLNAATQGTQADLLNVAMHRLNAWGWSWAFRFPLHDEILLEVPEWMAEQACSALEAAMTVTYRGVTLHCEATIEGRTWLPQPEQFTLADLPEEGDE